MKRVVRGQTVQVGSCWEGRDAGEAADGLGEL